MQGGLRGRFSPRRKVGYAEIESRLSTLPINRLVWTWLTDCCRITHYLETGRRRTQYADGGLSTFQIADDTGTDPDLDS